MTVYWVDPLATVDGTGTYASPFFHTRYTPTYLANGDEVRVKAHLLTDMTLRTDTTIVGFSQWNANYLYFAGASTNYATNDMVYCPQTGKIGIIHSVGSTVQNGITYEYIKFNKTIQNPCFKGHNLAGNTIKKIDPAYVSTNTGDNVMFPFQIGANVTVGTVTDGWVSETSRITDGSAMTIWSTTSSNTHMFRHNQQSAVVVDYANSFAVPREYNDYTRFTGMNGNLWLEDATINMAQVGGGYSNESLQITGNYNNVNDNIRASKMTFNIGVVAVYYGIRYCTAMDITLNIGDWYSHSGYFLESDFGEHPNRNLAIDVDNIFLMSVTSSSQGSSLIEVNGGDGNTNISIGKIYWTDPNISGYWLNSAVRLGYSGVVTTNITFKSGFDVKFVADDSSCNVATDANFRPIHYGYARDNLNNQKLKKPTNNSTFVFPDEDSLVLYDAGESSNSLGQVMGYMDATEYTSVHFNSFNKTGYQQYIDLAGDDFVIATGHAGLGKTGEQRLNRAYLMYGTPDTVMYETTSPSYKFNLATYSDKMMGGKWCTKVPVQSGTTVTITAKIRTDSTNDLGTMKLYNPSGAAVSSFSFTSSCVNAWETATLTYTPTQDDMCLLEFVFIPTSAPQNFWVSDLEIAHG